MFSLTILHHGQCFDGAASAAIVSEFLRQHLGLGASVQRRYIPKDHRPGDPYDESDFIGDIVASVDFRYTKDERLTWFFDHHHSSFQLPGDREHFDRDTSGRKFHDPTEISCAGYIARIARARFACDLSAHEALIAWADRIDAAAFPDPAMPVALELPAMRVMAFVEANREPALVERLIDDLLTTPIASIAGARYVQDALTPVLARHAQDVDHIGRRIQIDGCVAHFDLLDQAPRAINKFIPYFHHPAIPYVVYASRGPERHIKITAGYNPWLPKSAMAHNMAQLLEPYGGGGHPFVAGCRFDADEEERALRTVHALVGALNAAPVPAPVPSTSS
jgi:hypothetical protein